MTAPTRDGCWVFVALAGGSKAGLAVLRRGDGRVTLERTVKVKGGLTGLVLTHDGELLIGTDGAGVVLMDVKRLTDGTADDPVVGVIHDERRRITWGGRGVPPPMLAARMSEVGSIQANLTRDDKLLFVANENVGTITVIDLGKVRTSGDATDAILGRIPAGNAPIGLQFSADERWLFATSQSAGPDWGWPAVCAPENSRLPGTKHAEGAVLVVDVARSRSDPAHAVAARVPAGCNPVRLALGSAGDRVYVTARGSGEVLAFDAAALVADQSHALLGRVPVGPAPVPVVVMDGVKKVIVGNSNRFARGGAGSLTVLDAARIGSGAAAVIGTIACGEFPRHLALSPDGQTLFVANFGSSSLQVMDVARLPMEAAGR